MQPMSIGWEAIMGYLATATWIGAAMGTALISRTKGRGAFLWLLVGFLLGPLAVLLALANPSPKRLPRATSMTIAGITLLVVGAWAFFLAAPHLNDIAAPVGSYSGSNMGSGFSGNGGIIMTNHPPQELDPQTWKTAYYAGIVLMIFGGIITVPGLVALALQGQAAPLRDAAEPELDDAGTRNSVV